MGLATSDMEQAFAVLRDAVADLNNRGRRALGATLKPDMVKRTYGGFDEKQLGFSSFGDFVRKARDGGFVDIFQAPNSPDFEVVPAGTQPAPPEPAKRAADTASPTADGFIRHDLWKAFVDWNDSLIRLYDVEADTTVMFPREPAPLEPASYAQARQAWAANPDRYREIKPIGIETQMVWMREFVAAEADSPQKTILEYALTTDRPIRDFSQAVRQYPDIGRKWQIFRKDRVMRAIAEWKEESGVELSPYMPPAAGPVTTRAPRATEPLEACADVDRIRARVHQAVNRMSAADLLRLPIPVEYLLEN